MTEDTDFAFNADVERGERTGLHEAVYCLSKTPSQVEKIIDQLQSLKPRALFTKLDPDKFNKLAEAQRTSLTYHETSQTATLGASDGPFQKGVVAVVSGGTSDAHVVEEIASTLRFYNLEPTIVQDVGVAGLWRLVSVAGLLEKFPIIIAVAGMEAALPTVLSGLVKSVIIAVPVSTGYGVAAGGLTALNSLLSSCSPGMTVVNIDNGFGAACAAVRIFNNRLLLAEVLPEGAAGAPLNQVKTE